MLVEWIDIDTRILDATSRKKKIFKSMALIIAEALAMTFILFPFIVLNQSSESACTLIVSVGFWQVNSKGNSDTYLKIILLSQVLV